MLRLSKAAQKSPQSAQRPSKAAQESPPFVLKLSKAAQESPPFVLRLSKYERGERAEKQPTPLAAIPAPGRDPGLELTLVDC